jgi:hypothetical protein
MLKKAKVLENFVFFTCNTGQPDFSSRILLVFGATGPKQEREIKLKLVETKRKHELAEKEKL